MFSEHYRAALVLSAAGLACCSDGRPTSDAASGLDVAPAGESNGAETRHDAKGHDAGPLDDGAGPDLASDSAAPEAGCYSDVGGCGDADRPAPDSPYLTTVELPPCGTAANPPAGVRHIASAEDWRDLGDTSYRVFCVHPGDYLRAGAIVLARSGTAALPLVLRAFDPRRPRSMTHPVRLADGERALIAGLDFGASRHWLVAGLAIGRTEKRENLVRFAVGASSNLLDRLLIETGGNADGQVSLRGDDNAIQRSVLRATTVSPGQDNHCIAISAGAKRTRVVGNELYDCAGDGIQLGGGDPDQTYDGTLIADNDIYCRDHCGKGESGIDLEAGGSAGEDHWLRVEFNRIWGHMAGGGDSEGSIHEALIEASQELGQKGYVLLLSNLLFDGYHAIKPEQGNRTSAGTSHHWSIVGNVIHSMDEVALTLGHNTPAAEVYFNTIVNVRAGGQWLSIDATSADADVLCNLVVDGRGYRLKGPAAVVSSNALIGDTVGIGEQNTTGRIASAQLQQHCFEIERLTGPRRHCLSNARPTIVSPHIQACSARVGEREGVGLLDVVSAWQGPDGRPLGAPRIGALAP